MGIATRLQVRFGALAPLHISGRLALFILAHLALALPLPIAVRGLAALLIITTPGAVVAHAWFAFERDGVARAFLGVCGAVALAPLVLLLLQSLPGPLESWQVLAGCDVLVAAAAWRWWRRQRATPTARLLPPKRAVLVALGVVLLVGAALRLPFSGTAEFGYDEAQVMTSAVQVLRGDDDALLLRRKGPVEVLLPAGQMALVGQVHEGMARQSFLLASLGVLLGAFVLGRSLFPAHGAQAGTIAAAILALDGYMIGFARFVQYQSVVVLMMLAAVWCAWRYASGQGQQRLVVAAALFVSVGLLAHYDAAFAVLPVAWLVVRGAWRRTPSLGAIARTLAPASLVGGVVLASFALPFFGNEQVGRVGNYLWWRVAGADGAGIRNNLATYADAAMFYNTTFQVYALALVLSAACTWWLWSYCRPRPLAVVLAALLALAISAGVTGTGAWLGSAAAPVLLAGFALPLGALALAYRTPAALRTVLLWFAPAFLAEAFVIALPNTHFYALDAPLALLAAGALASLLAASSGWARASALGGSVAVVALALPYLLGVYVQPWPEYQRTFPAERPALYAAPYGDRLPAGSYLGFPHRDGWKVIDELYRRGLLHGSYRSNERTPITRWYLRHAAPDDEPNLYFAARQVPGVQVPIGYALFGSVLVRDEPTLDIYTRQRVTQAPQVFRLEDFAATFDGHRLITEVNLPPPAVPHPEPADFGAAIHFRGYDLDSSALASARVVTLTLQWQALAATGEDYRLFVHVLDTHGTLLGQVDGSPDGQAAGTNAWQAGSYHWLVQAIPLSQAPTSGDYWIALGLYRPSDGSRLPLQRAPNPRAPSDGGDALVLGPFQ